MSRKKCSVCGGKDRAARFTNSTCPDCTNAIITPGRGTFIGNDESSIGGGDSLVGLRIPMGGFLGGYSTVPDVPLHILAGMVTGDLKFKGCYDTPNGKVCHAKKTKKGKGSKGSK
jgi:hypothetical protein